MPAAQTAYPELAAEFEVLERELVGAFRELDNAALRAQNTFYLTQLVFTLGAILATALGAMHAALGGGQPVIGFLEAGLTALLGAGALRAYSQGAQRAYYTKRLQAERLRSEYFLFIGGLGPYADAAQRERTLRERVDDIQT